MIALFPATTETLVLPIGGDEVEKRIASGLESRRFTGTVGNGKFRLAPYVLRPPQFQPVMNGRIESTSRGSVVFLRYQLYPATRLIVGFVMAVLVTAALVALLLRTDAKYPLLFAGLAVLLRAIAVVNIRLHRDPVRKNLLQLLE